MANSDDLETLPGVGPATAEKLKGAGYKTFQAVATANSGELAEEADVGDSTASDVIQAAREEADVGGFDTAMEVNEQRKQISKIKTLVPDLDKMLSGGVETQSITEFYGGFGAGKSQFTHQLCVNVQLPPEHGGANGRAIFIDTEDSFRPERITDMVRGLDEDILEAVIERENLDITAKEVKNSSLLDESGERTEGTPAHKLSATFLSRINVAKAFTSNHQMLLVEKALEIANEHADSDFPVRLMCLDSIMAHFRSEYVGRGELANRQQKLSRHLHDIKKVADLNNAACVIANQVQSNPDSYFGDPTKPVGGNILGHAATFRLYIKVSKGDKRIVKLVDAPNLPDGEAVIEVVEDGLKPE